jgi:hypothetical protein
MMSTFRRGGTHDASQRYTLIFMEWDRTAARIKSWVPDFRQLAAA